MFHSYSICARLVLHQVQVHVICWSCILHLRELLVLHWRWLLSEHHLRWHLSLQRVVIHEHLLLLCLIMLGLRALRVDYLVVGLRCCWSHVQKWLELLRQALIILAPEVMLTNCWLGIEITNSIYIDLTLTRANHQVVIVWSHLRLGVNLLKIMKQWVLLLIFDALEVRALLKLVYVMKVVSHVDSGELIEDCLALDCIFGDFIGKWIDLRSEWTLFHILLELILLHLVELFLFL